MKVINLFAGPGAGKSTTRADLFSKMKRQGISVEEVTEYAKDIVWENNLDKLSDQLYITAKQNRKLSRLVGKVDWCVSDSPLLLGIHYALPTYLPQSYQAVVKELWTSYHNINFFIKRVKPYAKIGRYQTEEEAKQIDRDIQDMLWKNGIKYIEVQGDETGVEKILNKIYQIAELEKTQQITQLELEIKYGQRADKV